jgi:hypothetical protein
MKQQTKWTSSQSVKQLTALAMPMPNNTRSPSLDRTSMNQCRTYSPDSCEILSISHVVIYKTVICCFQRRYCKASPPCQLPVTNGTRDAHSNPCPLLQFFLSLSIYSSFLPTRVSAVLTGRGGRALVISIYLRMHFSSWDVVLEKNGEDQLDWSCEKWRCVTKSQGERNVLQTVKWRKAVWIGHSLCRDCLLKQVIKGKIEVTGRLGRRRKQLLDDLQEKTGYWTL